MHGFGLPSGDMFTFKGKVMYSKIRKSWICTVCNFERSKYERRQVFGHVETEKGYQSRLKNDRRNIPGGERYNEEKVATKPGNIDIYTAQEISYGNIELELIGGECISKCLKCAENPIFQDMRPVSLRNRLSHARKECPPGRVICPYYPSTIWRMGGLKKALSKK